MNWKAILTFSLFIVLAACKAKDKSSEADDKQNEQNGPAAEEKKNTVAASEPKTYQLVFAPDSVLLGKDKEAFIKILGGEAVELQDVDGKSTGMNIKIKLRETNRSSLDNKKFFGVYPGDARLELDNGTNVTSTSGDGLSAEPEASTEAEWVFETPAGTKPTKLNLFYDGTRVSVSITMK
jgi:hypothetical protein